MVADSGYVTLCQISDVHLAALVSDTPSSADAGYSRAVALVKAEGPDAIVITGDITDDGSEAACRRAHSIVDVVGAPVLATPGNHDRPDIVRSTFGAADGLSLGAWRLVCVDTVVPGQDAGSVDPRSVADRLGSDDSTPTVLAMHHPPVTTSTHADFRLHGAAEFVEMLLARTDVRVVLSGHLHQAFHVVVGRVSFLGCSSSYYSLEHCGEEMRRDHGHVGALRLRLHDDGRWDWMRMPSDGRRFPVETLIAK